MRIAYLRVLAVLILVDFIFVDLIFVNRAQAESRADWMLQLSLGGRKIEGMPLAWNTQEIYLLGRDGRLWQFSPEKATDYRKTSNRFSSYSAAQLRSMLLGELGEDFDVTGTGHYLVAHPQGERDQWAERFEDLYRSFVHYFAVIGLRPGETQFPLLGIVCRDRLEFLEFSASHGLPVAAGILGAYSLASNRILLYDVSPGVDSVGWRQNASTLIHEATHQTAFNTGIHSRYAPTPVWVAEGLATMFEAPGVYDCRYHTRQTDRINRGRLRQFNELVAPELHPEMLADLVASDRLFRTNPSAAYATAWALTFYLVETRRGQYADYLALTGKRPAFRPYSAADRTDDFATVFGNDWPMLEAELSRFTEGLK